MTEQTYPFTISRTLASLYMNRKRDIPNEVRELATTPAKRKALPEWFSKNILPHLQEGEKTELLLQSVRQSLKHADNLEKGKVKEILEASADRVEELLARAFLLLLSVDNRKKEAEADRKGKPCPEHSQIIPGTTDLSYMDYLAYTLMDYGRMRSLVNPNTPQTFESVYVCNNILLAGNNGAEDVFACGPGENSIKAGAEANPLCGKYDRGVAVPEGKQAETAVPALVENCTPWSLADISRFIILRGTGGVGKSMMMIHLLIDCCLNFDENRPFIPLYASLRNFCNSDAALVEDLYDCLCQCTEYVSFEEFERDLRRGVFLLLLDGLDEISVNSYHRFEKKLKSFIYRYRNNCFVMTSRPISDFLNFNRFEVMELQPLTKQQAMEMIRRLEYRLDRPELKESFLKALDEKLYDANQSFAGNPLLLELMLMTYERCGGVPEKMHHFYAEAYKVMAFGHDETKDGWQREYRSGLTHEELEHSFAEFCARSYMTEKFSLRTEEAREIFEHLHSLKRWQKNVSFMDFMADLCNCLCIMYEKGDQYIFLHRSFQEYFCALYFSRQSDQQLFAIADALESLDRFSYDFVFGMMYDMIPARMECFVFIPALEAQLGAGREQSPEKMTSTALNAFIIRQARKLLQPDAEKNDFDLLANYLLALRQKYAYHRQKTDLFESLE